MIKTTSVQLLNLRIRRCLRHTCTVEVIGSHSKSTCRQIRMNTRSYHMQHESTGPGSDCWSAKSLSNCSIRKDLRRVTQSCARNAEQPDPRGWKPDAARSERMKALEWYLQDHLQNSQITFRSADRPCTRENDVILRNGWSIHVSWDGQCTTKAELVFHDPWHNH